MNTSLPIRRLCWKELRQIAPLIMLLVGIAAILQLLFLVVIADPYLRNSGRLAVFLGMPGLFAVGVGALLIGQERELRTVQWLSTLPINLRTLASVKLLVSLGALVVVWLLSGILTLVAAGGSAPVQSAFGVQNSPAEMASWPLHTLFIVLAGTALAWQCRSSMIALIALIPVALLPFLLASTLSFAWGSSRDLGWSEAPPAVLLLIVQLVCCVAAAVWGTWAARRALAPAAPARIKNVTEQAYVPQLELGPPLQRNTALLWQSYAQNKALLLSGGAIGLLAVTIALLQIGRAAEAGLVWAVFLLCIAACWLGVTVFQGDRLHNRIGFLADRGVGSTRVWWTRQAFPLAIAVLCGLLVCGAASLVLGTTQEGSAPATLLICVALIGSSLAIYAFSQWASQLFSSPIVACIAAPAISLAGVGYLLFSATNLGSPVWLLAWLSFIPMLLTFVLNRAWMDRQFGPAYWFRQAVGIGAFVVLPIIPLLVTWMTAQQMPSSLRQELAASVESDPLFWRSNPKELVLASFDGNQSDELLAAVAPEQIRSARAELLPSQRAAMAFESLQDQLNNSSGPVRVPSRVSSFLTFEMQRLRMLLDGSAEFSASDSDAQPETAARDEDLSQRYLDLLRTSLDIVSRLRLSPRVIDQDVADLMEIAILLELRQTAQAAWMSVEIVSAAQTQLASEAARNAARQRAVAASWSKFQYELTKPGGARQYGGYELPQPSASDWRSILRQRGRVGRMVGNLWQLAKLSNSDAPSASEPFRKGLADFWWWSSESNYGLSSNPDYFRANDLPKFLLSFNVNSPGQQWQAAWESAIEELPTGP